MTGLRHRPVVVAIDVVGTLFSLDPVADRMRGAGLPDQALDETPLNSIAVYHRLLAMNPSPAWQAPKGILPSILVVRCRYNHVRCP
jgi:hypothetical protein